MNYLNALNVMTKKKSQLCIGIDFALPPEDRQVLALELIDQTAKFAAAYKPNRQFWLGTSIEEMRVITKRIHHHGSFAIIDHKLSDIGSSNSAAIKFSHQEGFDFMTVSPFPGNLEETYNEGKKYNLGIIALVLMSNTKAQWMLKHYHNWALEAKSNADGIVIGTTNHVTSTIIQRLSKLFTEQFILAPGLGQQGGRIDAMIKYFGNRVLFNVSRGINQAKDFDLAASSFYQQINHLSGVE